MNKYQKTGILPTPKRSFKGSGSKLDKQTTISKEWASQFWAKQYFKSKYVLSEKNLKKIVMTNKSADSCTSNIIKKLDHRLDTIVYTLGWAQTLKEARHLIKKNKIGIIKPISPKTCCDNMSPGAVNLYATKQKNADNNKSLSERNWIINNPGVKIRIGEKISLILPKSNYKVGNNALAKNMFIIKKENSKITATLLRPTESKLGGNANSKKFELYCQKFK